MSHPHLRVHQIVSGTEVFPVYCLAEHQGWTISHTTQSIVLGHRIPRLHIPLATVVTYGLQHASPDCPYSDDPMVKAAGALMDMIEDDDLTTLLCPVEQDGMFCSKLIYHEEREHDYTRARSRS